MTNVVDIFLDLVKYDTQSNDKSGEHPSTPTQLSFANHLGNMLAKLGLQNVIVTENAYVYGYLEGNYKSKSVGFIAHMDTSPDYSSENVNPRIIKYKGGDITLNCGITISPKLFPDLLNYIDEEIITADGNSLLGADNKAGIAEIISALSYFIENPNEKRPDIYVCFTPDEEIGEGALFFDLDIFKADFAYTVDGGKIGELNFENFNASVAKLDFKGISVHPGTSKNKMKNAILIANEFINMLPAYETPATTEHYEGFFHITDIKGDVSNTFVNILIRDFFNDTLLKRKQYIEDTVAFLRKKHNIDINLTINDQYENMAQILESHKYIIDIAKEAMTQCNVKPDISPIRGGTDGARISYMGLPCPNIFTGGHNFHGPYEFIPISSMIRATEVIATIAGITCNY